MLAPLSRCAMRAVRAVNTVVGPVARRGWLAPGPLGAGVIALGATGRRSGVRAFRPLAAVRVGTRTVVGTARPRSDWVANLAADPAPVVVGRGREDVVVADVRRLAPFGTIAVLRPSDEPVTDRSVH